MEIKQNNSQKAVIILSNKVFLKDWVIFKRKMIRKLIKKLIKKIIKKLIKKLNKKLNQNNKINKKKP